NDAKLMTNKLRNNETNNLTPNFRFSPWDLYNPIQENVKGMAEKGLRREFATKLFQQDRIFLGPHGSAEAEQISKIFHLFSEAIEMKTLCLLHDSFGRDLIFCVENDE